MYKKEEKALDKKEVRNMVSEINPDKNSLGSRG